MNYLSFYIGLILFGLIAKPEKTLSQNSTFSTIKDKIVLIDTVRMEGYLIYDKENRISFLLESKYIGVKPPISKSIKKEIKKKGIPVISPSGISRLFNIANNEKFPLDSIELDYSLVYDNKTLYEFDKRYSSLFIKSTFFVYLAPQWMILPIVNYDSSKPVNICDQFYIKIVVVKNLVPAGTPPARNKK